MKQTVPYSDGTARWLRRLAPGPWADRLPPRWRVTLIILALSATVMGGGCAVYLSLRGSGALSTVAWIPDAIAQWADRHGRLRNLPAYFLLAVPVLLVSRDTMARIRATLAVGIFGTVLELAEYFIPRREVEWQDVAWSWVGAVLAWLLVEGAAWSIERLRANNPCVPQS